MAGVSIMRLGAFQLTREKGYDVRNLSSEERAKESARGHDWTDGFSPFYADWKLVGRMSYPLFYTMPNSEIIRKFLLLKNKGDRQVIDIDEMLDAPRKSGEGKAGAAAEKKAEEKKAEEKKTDGKPPEGKKDK
jgi:hypothetical protein